MASVQALLRRVEELEREVETLKGESPSSPASPTNPASSASPTDQPD
jgi:hypothetical protein